jgi:PAS domain S-box-containing protein
MIPSPSQAFPPGLLDQLEALAQLELKDRALAACAEGITIADARLPGQPLIYINAGFERLTGYSAAEVLGRNCRFLQGPATDPATVDLLRRAIREQREVTVQLINYRKNGTPFWNRLSITPVRDQAGLVTHLIGVQSDVTPEVEAQEALLLANRRLESAARIIKQDLEAAAESQQALLPAGHLGPIHLHHLAPPLIGETTGIPVGVLANAAYEQQTIQLAPGDRLYLCTDGLYEAENHAREDFGIDRLLSVLEAGRTASLEQSLSSLMDRVRLWHGDHGAEDDSSILAIERTP